MKTCEFCGATVRELKQHYTSLKCLWYRDYLNGKQLNEYQMCLLIDARLIPNMDKGF